MVINSESDVFLPSDRCASSSEEPRESDEFDESVVLGVLELCELDLLERLDGGGVVRGGDVGLSVGDERVVLGLGLGEDGEGDKGERGDADGEEAGFVGVAVRTSFVRDAT